MNHCTMSGNRVPTGRYGAAIEIRDSLTTVIINNSILYHNWNGTGNHDVFAQGILEIYHSCFQYVDYSDHFYDSWVDENNINEDPQFCFPGDYTIAETSPCAGSANDGTNMGSYEIGCEDSYTWEGPLWYVSNDGSDFYGAGSPDFPLETIQNAVSLSSDGDTIVIYQGSYNEYISIGDKQLTIGSLFMFEPDQNELIDLTIVDGDSSQQIFSISGSQIEIIGLTLQNGYSDNWGGAISCGSYSDLTIKNSIIKNSHAGSSGGGINSNRSNLFLDSVIFTGNSSPGAGSINAGTTDESIIVEININNCTFSDNYSEGTTAGAQLGWGPSEVFISNSTFENNNSYKCAPFRIYTDFEIDSCVINNNYSESYSGGGAIFGPSTGFIKNSIFSNNSVDESNPNGNTGGLLIGDSVNVDIINCTFVNNTSIETGGLKTSGSSNTNIINSIFSGNTPDEIGVYYWNESCPAIEIDFSLIRGGIESVYFDTSTCNINWGENNIDADPLFCDPDSGDFSLAEGSPCIGTGQDGVNIGALGIGCEALSSDETPSLTPIDYVLHQNYPNPFNPITKIRFDLPEDADIQLSVYDVLGREVAELVNGRVLSGFHEVIWDASDVSSGVYLCQLTTLNSVITNKMVVVK